MKLSFSLMLLSLVIIPSDAQDQCKAIARRVDRSFRSFFYVGDENIKLPVNKTELTEHCRLPQRAIKSLKKYKESCTKGLSNQILQLAVTGISNAIQSMCAPENQDRTIEVNRCITVPAIKSFHDCFYRGERMLETVSRVANATNILPLTCCAFNFFDECVFSSIDETCPDSNIKINDYFSQFFDLALDNVRDLACGRLKTVSKCEESHPRQTRRLRRIYQSKDSNDDKRGSFIFSLVEISSKLSEE